MEILFYKATLVEWYFFTIFDNYELRIKSLFFLRKEGILP